MNKRILGGIMAAGLAFSAFSASAAGLGVSADPLQVGSTTDLSCDDNGVRVTVNYGDQEAVPAGGSQSATVTDISPECDGAYVTVLALDGAGNELGRATTVADTDGSVTTGPWTNNTGTPIARISALDTEKVEVHING